MIQMTIFAMGEIINEGEHHYIVVRFMVMPIYGVTEFMGITSFFMTILEKILCILQNYFEGGFE